MSRLSAQEKRDFAAHEDWRAWGAKFGWHLKGSNGEYGGEFSVHGDRVYITLSARADIDRVIAANR